MARGAALKHGATPLEALVVGQVAAYGAICWLKDRELAEEIVQRNGRNPHPRSIARARRNSARSGLLQSERCFPGSRIPGKRGTVSYGTTAKIVVFGPKFGVRDPLTRGQKRRMRLRQMAVEADYAPTHDSSVAQPSGSPKHTAVMVPPMDPQLAAVVAELGDTLGAKWQREQDREDRRMMDSVRALRAVEQSRGPPPKR